MTLQAFLSAALLLAPVAPVSLAAHPGYAFAAEAGETESKEDGKIHDLIMVKLAGDQLVGGAGRIEVEVTKGVVKLTGRVDNDKQKARAEHLAKRVKGVKSVANQLVIQPR